MSPGGYKIPVTHLVANLVFGPVQLPVKAEHGEVIRTLAGAPATYEMFEPTGPDPQPGQVYQLSYDSVTRENVTAIFNKKIGATLYFTQKQ